jgi:bidirectional [NiFe] hydrogenase diaphorase subunit
LSKFWGQFEPRSMIPHLARKRKLAPPVPEHPSGDKRFKILDVHIKRFQYRADALIEVLHKAQDLFGYLDKGLLSYVSRKLKLPPSRVYGVATFYHLFTLKPKGKHTCVVCTGTACYVKGADAILTALERRAEIGVGDTTPDEKLSLLTARCIGACGLAPTVVYDEQVVASQTPETAVQKIEEWLK